MAGHDHFDGLPGIGLHRVGNTPDAEHDGYDELITQSVMATMECPL
jgi:hypothetical protein